MGRKKKGGMTNNIKICDMSGFSPVVALGGRGGGGEVGR